MVFAAFCNGIIFLLLAGIHAYRALGGRRWINAVLPTTGKTDAKLFAPGSVVTGLVAAGLLLPALLSFSAVPVFARILSARWVVYGHAGIAILFTLRALGDFRYVGFFKKIKHTPFAGNDSRYYSPLCLVVALLALLIVVTLKTSS